ncbi:MAG: HAD hydrolase-like protein [Candidatus Diapherotrites archaeon]|nr:HAD hydrolase-like protein [Candidatus Diapherotrites archaeon]
MPIKALLFDSGFCLQNDPLIFNKTVNYIAKWLQKQDAIKSAKAFKETFFRVDSSVHSEQCWSHIFAEPIVINAVFEELNITKVLTKQLIREWRKYQKTLFKPNPRFRAALKWAKAKALKTAIASNDRAERLHAIVDVHRVRELLDAIVVSEEVRVEKPDLRFFEIVLERLQVKGNEAIMFGDNPISDGACKELGIKFVQVTKYKPPYTMELGKEYEPDFVINEVNKKNVRAVVKAFSE